MQGFTLCLKSCDNLLGKTSLGSSSMKEEDKTEEQLQKELREMRQRLVASENKLKQVEKELQQERHLLANVLDTTDSLIRNFVGAVLDVANALIVVFDYQGRILNCNITFQQITHYSLPEVKGKHFWELFSVPDEVNKVKSAFEEIKAGQKAKPYECSWIIKSGECRYISWTYITIKNKDDNLEYILGNGVDITERKIVEAEIRKNLEKERELNELKARFVSIASHEFRTPLTTIIMSAAILERCSQNLSEERKLEEYHRIKATVHRMTQLLDDVLVIGRAESGLQSFNPRNLDLEKLCRELVEEVQQSISSNHTITFTSLGLCINACMDERLLRHIFTNLLSNAVKYSPKGGTVHFELSCQNKKVIFQIKDSGMGIPPADRERLFEPFHRGKNVGLIPGTGLGLSIVKTMVDLHQGEIQVKSEVGVGTTFIVTLAL